MAVQNIMPEPELTPSVPAPVVETPSEEAPAETPVVETPVVETPAVELFKMPDGRELTGAQVKEEYEKLLPEFTIKSQRLAEIERAKNDADVPEWKREGYTPKSYAEIIEIATKQAAEDIARKSEAEAAEHARVAAQVDAQVTALKARDPKLDENALFAHANKYGFRDLNMAYENMAAMKGVEIATEQRLKPKKIDPIATGGGNGGGSAPRYSPAGSAVEFMKQIRK